MLKKSYLIILLFPSLSLLSQDEYKVFTGFGIGTHDYSHVRIGVRHSLMNEKYASELTYNTDFYNHLIHLRLGFRIFQVKKWKVRTMVYLPYLNFNVTEFAYNTPFCVEIFKENIFNVPYLSTSVNIDIYKNKAIPQIRFTLTPFIFKEK